MFIYTSERWLNSNRIPAILSFLVLFYYANIQLFYYFVELISIVTVELLSMYLCLCLCNPFIMISITMCVCIFSHHWAFSPIIKMNIPKKMLVLSCSHFYDEHPPCRRRNSVDFVYSCFSLWLSSHGLDKWRLPRKNVLLILFCHTILHSMDIVNWITIQLQY